MPEDSDDPKDPDDDASVLTPEELRLDDEQEDAVRKIGENRYVIRPNEDGSDDGVDPEAADSGPLADPTGRDAATPDSASPRQDAGEQRSPSPASTTSRRDTESHSDSSPRSTMSREDAGGRIASSEPSDASAPEDADEHNSSPDSTTRSDADARSGPNVDVEARALALEHTAGEFGIDAVVDTGDGIAERRLVADDRVAVFEEFLRWYARQIDPDASPATTISALLAEADLSE